ncbi:hypothetical protein RKD31_000833 [Streptomyces sp. SAI-163]
MGLEVFRYDGLQPFPQGGHLTDGRQAKHRRRNGGHCREGLRSEGRLPHPWCRHERPFRERPRHPGPRSSLRPSRLMTLLGGRTARLRPHRLLGLLGGITARLRPPRLLAFPYLGPRLVGVLPTCRHDCFLSGIHNGGRTPSHVPINGRHAQTDHSDTRPTSPDRRSRQSGPARSRPRLNFQGRVQSVTGAAHPACPYEPCEGAPGSISLRGEHAARVMHHKCRPSSIWVCTATFRPLSSRDTFIADFARKSAQKSTQ